MRARGLIAFVCIAALAGCATSPQPTAAPTPITDQTMGGKFGTMPTATASGSSVNYRANVMQDLRPATTIGCVPRAGVFQRGTLLCPGQGG